VKCPYKISRYLIFVTHEHATFDCEMAFPVVIYHQTANTT